MPVILDHISVAVQVVLLHRGGAMMRFSPSSSSWVTSVADLSPFVASRY